MSLSLPAIRGLAASIASEEGSTLDLLGTMAAEGATDYVEVIFGERASAEQPRRLVVTVKRRMPKSDVERTLRRGVRAHLRKTA